MNQRLVERTLFTEIGMLIGTPEYMSPEQADLTGLDVDSTTDIYSLGVLLYELLVGALPFDSRTLRKAGYGEIQRMIREEEPPKPSTRLSSMGHGAQEVARRRRSDVRTLIRLLRGDLEWIAMKALEKDRTRRYASASEFAADIGRHLGNEPVAARPPRRRRSGRASPLPWHLRWRCGTAPPCRRCAPCAPTAAPGSRGYRSTPAHRPPAGNRRSRESGGARSRPWRGSAPSAATRPSARPASGR